MENFIRMVLLLKEVATELVWKVLENKYQPDDFKSFLLQKKHILYHLYLNKGCCCACGPNAKLPNQQLQDRIKRLKDRKILAAAEEYTECLHHILQWNMQTENVRYFT